MGGELLKVLLDTCTFLWLWLNSPDLSDRARGIASDPDNELFLSSVSTWEITLKYALGRLPLPQAPDAYIPQLRRRLRIEALALDEESALFGSRLPLLHRDPFDRMLVCQAIVGGLVVLTPDRAVTQYTVRAIW